MNNTPTPVHTRAQPRSKREKLPYPAPPETGHPHFWLTHFLRDTAELDALAALVKKCFQSSKSSLATKAAMAGALTNAEQEVVQSAEATREDGEILFAWPGTTTLTARTVILCTPVPHIIALRPVVKHMLTLYNCAGVIEDFRPEDPLLTGAVHLSRARPSEFKALASRAIVVDEYLWFKGAA